MEVLNQSRFDKVKPVREATIEAYHTIKNLEGDDDSLTWSSHKPAKNAKPTLKDAIKQAKRRKTNTSDELDSAEIVETLKLSSATQK